MGMGSFQEHLQLLSIELVPFIMAVVLHEYAHGFIANRWGDPTAKDAGRLTMNPIPHMDFFGTLVFPMINMLSGINLLFGWAKPVPIDPRRFRKYRHGLFWVAIAGPGMNFLLAVISAAAVCAMYRWVPTDFYLREPLVKMAEVSVSLNYALGIFNLIPLPPLDGSKIIEAFLSKEATAKFESLAKYSLLILIGLLITGSLDVLTYPISFASNVTLFAMGKIFGLEVL